MPCIKSVTTSPSGEPDGRFHVLVPPGGLAPVVAVLIEDGSSGDLRFPGTSLGGREQPMGFGGMPVGVGIGDGFLGGPVVRQATPWVS